MKILVAEDDCDQLAVRSLLLAHNGFEIVEAASRESALQVAADEKPDCALVDLRLPTEEIGLDLISKLKLLDSLMRIVVLTGSDPERLARKSERRLIDRVIRKGQPSALLIAALKTLPPRGL